MSDPLVTFSQKDLQRLKDIVRRVKHDEVNTTGRPPVSVHSVYMDTSNAPEIYIAKIPSSGLPAAEYVGTSGGPPTELTGAECEIYRVNGDDGSIEIVDTISKWVYNLSSKKIRGGGWALIQREKFGTWIATAVIQSQPGDSPGAGHCEFLTLNSNDCVLVTYFNSETGEQEKYYLEWDGGSGTWKGTDNFLYPGGSGTFEFGYIDGDFWLTLNAMDLVSCGDGCFSGSWITGHGSDLTGTGTPESTECNAAVFTVCVSCSCCPMDGWNGEGWYCISVDGTSTALGDCEIQYLLEEDQCDTDILICSGPYDSESEAITACTPWGGPYTTNCADAGASDAPIGQWIEGTIPASTTYYFCYAVSPGNYRLKYYRNTLLGGAGVGGLTIQGWTGDCTGTPAAPGTSISESALNACTSIGSGCCLNLTVPSGTTHICITFPNGNGIRAADYGILLEPGSC